MSVPGEGEARHAANFRGRDGAGRGEMQRQCAVVKWLLIWGCKHSAPSMKLKISLKDGRLRAEAARSWFLVIYGVVLNVLRRSWTRADTVVEAPGTSQGIQYFAAFAFVPRSMQVSECAQD